VVFGEAKPSVVIITTPNAEYNVNFEQLPAGSFRHKDHRFEWTRIQFKSWADKVAGEYGYSVGFHDIGPRDINLGGPTQMAVFARNEKGKEKQS
jgi:hypothetical protein